MVARDSNCDSIEKPVEYRDIADFPGYRVGDDGSVWSRKKAGGGLVDEWKKLRPGPSRGYPLVVLRKDNKHFPRKVHILVLTAFRGPRPAGLDSCHNNGDRSDARLTNLRWDTRKANAADRRTHGRDNWGECNYRASLTNAEALEIREAFAARNATPAQLAAQYGISDLTVRRVIRGLTFKQAGGPTVFRLRKWPEKVKN